jgi:hypothetical protein
MASESMVTSTPPQPGGSGTFRMATWNVVDGKQGRLKKLARRLAQMEVDVAVLTKTKFVCNKHPKTASRNTIMCSNAVRKN